MLIKVLVESWILLFKYISSAAQVCSFLASYVVQKVAQQLDGGNFVLQDRKVSPSRKDGSASRREV